jgi:hypothetical protein
VAAAGTGGSATAEEGSNVSSSSPDAQQALDSWGGPEGGHQELKV